MKTNSEFSGYGWMHRPNRCWVPVFQHCQRRAVRGGGAGITVCFQLHLGPMLPFVRRRTTETEAGATRGEERRRLPSAQVGANTTVPERTVHHGLGKAKGVKKMKNPD